MHFSKNSACFWPVLKFGNDCKFPLLNYRTFSKITEPPYQFQGHCNNSCSCISKNMILPELWGASVQFYPFIISLFRYGTLLLLPRLPLCLCVCSQSFPTLCRYNELTARLLCPWDFPGKNIGVSCHFLLWGIFLTEGLNLCLLNLLHWKAILYHQPHLGSPRYLFKLPLRPPVYFLEKSLMVLGSVLI